jgi:hypothetical protein
MKPVAKKATPAAIAVLRQATSDSTVSFESIRWTSAVESASGTEPEFRP